MLVSASTRIGGGSATYRPVPVRPQSVNAPVSYQLHEAKMQTLADGTHITQTMLVQRFWRDSQGGTRLERSYVALGNGNPQERIWPIAEITNPGAGFWYVLEVEKKIAHRGRLSAPPPTAAPPSAAIASVPGSEDLGTQTINGVAAQGSRMTATTPANSVGNDRPLIRTTETWTSPELRIVMLVKVHDPRIGDTTTELENFSRAEPAASLFAPPADYGIVDENGEFTVTWGTPPPEPPTPPPPPVPPSQGISGGGYRIGGGVSAPVPIYQPAPQYAEEGAAGGDSRCGLTEYSGR